MEKLISPRGRLVPLLVGAVIGFVGGVLVACLLVLNVSAVAALLGAEPRRASVQSLDPMGPRVPYSTRLYGELGAGMFETVIRSFASGREPENPTEVPWLRDDQIAVWSFGGYGMPQLEPGFVFTVDELMKVVELNEENLSARALVDEIVRDVPTTPNTYSHPSGYVVCAHDRNGFTLIAVKSETIRQTSKYSTDQAGRVLGHLRDEYERRTSDQ